MTTPPTPPADAVARLTKLADDYASRGDFATEDDIRTLLAAYADAARVVDAYLADHGVRWSPGAAQMAADLLALEALRAPAPSEAVLSATDLAYVFARRLVTDGVDLSRPVKLTHEMVERAMIGVVKSYRDTHPAPAPSEAVRKFSAAHTRAMSELEFTHGVGVRGDAPSEAVAWQLVHTRTGQRWTPATDRASVENQQREFAALGATETRIAALVDHHPAPARGVTVTEEMVEAGARALYDVPASAAPWASPFVRAHSWDSLEHRSGPDVRPSFREAARAILTAALTPDAEGGA